MKRRWLIRAAVAALALAALGAGVMFSGVIPVTASSGHWDITKWVLHTAMRRSVATHSMGITPPEGLDDLDDEALVLLGAGHYEHGCRYCHGAVGTRMPRVPGAMTPVPPWLPPRIEGLDDAELFYVVKHGVKFTGMPAWPAQERDDEVWALVAFLRRVPEMSQAEYRRLTQASSESAEAPPVVSRMCARCHGADGLSRGVDGAAPRLAGQRVDYLDAALLAYAEGHRPSGMMEPLAAELFEEDRRLIARWYASRPGMPAAPALAGASIERGAAIAERGVPEERVAACSECHGPSPTDRADSYPILSGQWAGYLRDQLQLFARGVRGGAPQAELMEEVDPHRLSPEEIRDVASYYARSGG